MLINVNFQSASNKPFYQMMQNFLTTLPWTEGTLKNVIWKCVFDA